MTAEWWVPALIAFAITTLATGRVLQWLRRSQIFDQPNERSSHTLPTPRGGGLAVTPAIVLGWTVYAAGIDGPLAWWLWACLIAAAALMALSWWDDRHPLPALPRFILHAIAVIAGMSFIPSESLVFQGLLPLWADRLLAVVGWLWFINLYNFMDGIDGITGIETISLGLGIAIISCFMTTVAILAPPALACAAAGLAFLRWNWHPARIFLGDVGSIPLGFLMGGLLVQLAAAGYLAVAVILPAYYLADATITLGRRALAGEKIWQPHRKHFYQRAVQGGVSHARVSLLVLAGNGGLLSAAIVTVLTVSWVGPILAVVTIIVMLSIMHIWSQGRGR